MRAVKAVLLSCAMLSLVGCAATGPMYKDVSASIPPLEADKGRIYFYRPDTILGAAVTADVNLNGRVVGRSERGSFFFVDEKPGNCAVATSTEVERRLTFTLAAGETRYVKTSISIGALVGRVNPELVGSDAGKAEIAELAYTGGVPLGKK